MSKWDKLWLHAHIVCCDEKACIIENGAIGVKDGKIAWLGSVDELTESPYHLASEVFDVSGQCLTPGFIDCHTHVVYAGSRAKEFEKRLEGASYAEIAKAGGGIQSTVNATRDASEAALYEQSLPRVKALQRSGVTTIEIKSGYGLNWHTERKMLRVAKRIADTLPITVKTTFLGAHTVPKEFDGDAQKYMDVVCQEMLPQVVEEQLADAVDIFCETIAFNVKQTEQLFRAASDLNLPIKCHGEQLCDSGSASLAAKYHALSVDHLEYVSKAGVSDMAKAGTIAVLLPGAYYTLRETQLPPIETLRELGVNMAIASDCNPGTSPISSLLIIMNMASTLFRLTPKEVLQGVTRHAASALGLDDRGSIQIGNVADFAIWRVDDPVELIYAIGTQPLVQLVRSGEVINHMV